MSTAELTIVILCFATVASPHEVTLVLSNLTAVITGSAITSCSPPAVLVTDPSGAWNSDLNAGAGGKYVYLCATYVANTSSQIVAIQAAGLTSKYKPNCDYDAGYAPIDGNLNEGSKSPGSVYLCVKRASGHSVMSHKQHLGSVPISQISGAIASTGCGKDHRAINSVESPATPFNFDPAGTGVVLCIPATPPPVPPSPPPGPREWITELQVLVVGASSGLNVSCPSGLQLLRPMNSTPMWDLDFNTGAGGDYAYLCVGRNSSQTPIRALLGFHTPSAADPFENCPANYTKVIGNSTEVGANDLNHGSRNVGAMYLCYRKDSGLPFYDLAAFEGGGNASTGVGCKTAGWETILGPPAYPGVFNFDPSGKGLTLCADRSL